MTREELLQRYAASLEVGVMTREDLLQRYAAGERNFSRAEQTCVDLRDNDKITMKSKSNEIYRYE